LSKKLSVVIIFAKNKHRRNTMKKIIFGESRIALEKGLLPRQNVKDLLNHLVIPPMPATEDDPHNENLFVAFTVRDSYEDLYVNLANFSYDKIWNAKYGYRFILPQQTL
jgi:hypothetical protein